VNYLEYDPARILNFPIIDEIIVDAAEGRITVTAANYDEIRWISSHEPAIGASTDEYDAGMEFTGRIVATGKTIHINSKEELGRYVRAELINTFGDEEYRLFTNPFAIVNKRSR
jgi:hypothetical protein